MILGDLASMSPVTGQQVPDDGSWEDWCDKMWPPSKDPGTNVRCKHKGINFLAMFQAPWTEGGARARNIPGPGAVGGPGGSEWTNWLSMAIDPFNIFGAKSEAQPGAVAQAAQSGLPSWLPLAAAAGAGLLLLVFAAKKGQP